VFIPALVVVVYRLPRIRKELPHSARLFKLQPRSAFLESHEKVSRKLREVDGHSGGIQPASGDHHRSGRDHDDILSAVPCATIASCGSPDLFGNVHQVAP
jgi:hypothetical protein